MATKPQASTSAPPPGTVPGMPEPTQGQFDPKNPATFPYHGDPDAVVKMAGPAGGDRVQTNEPSNWSWDDPKHLILVGGVPGLPIGDPADFVRTLTVAQKHELEQARRASRGRGGRDGKPGILDIDPPELPKLPDWVQPGVPPPREEMEPRHSDR